MSIVRLQSCREFVELVTAYLEDGLSPSELARFEVHLGVCRDCERYLAQMRQTLRALGRLGEEDIPEEGRDELMRAFRTWGEGSPEL